MTYLAALFLGLVLWAILTLRQDAEPEPTIGQSLDAAALQAERNRMQSAAVGVAEDVGLPHGMDNAMLDLADRMALEVHEGRRTPASAIQHMTAQARSWTREMRQAGAA